MKNLVIMVLLLLGFSCAHQIDILKANAVSMKHRELSSGAVLKKAVDIESTYCMKNKTHSGKDIALMDEVIKKAEEEYKVDFIQHVNFSLTSKGCIILTGEGMRIEK